MQVHKIKAWPEYYDKVESGEKPFEIRKNDRDYQVGDILDIQEYIPEVEHDPFGMDEIDRFTGRSMLRQVTYITDFQQQPGYIVMGIRKYVEQ